MSTPRKYALNCPDNCSLRPAVVGQRLTNVLLEMRENGAGGRTMTQRATEVLGRPVPSSNMQRHITHFVETKGEDEPVAAGPKPSDLAILDAIIVSGFQNSKSWKPTIRDTLEAMKLKIQMTGNSAFDDLIALFDVVDEDDPDFEAPEAVLSPGEIEEDVSDPDEPLGEPVEGL